MLNELLRTSREDIGKIIEELLSDPDSEKQLILEYHQLRAQKKLPRTNVANDDERYGPCEGSRILGRADSYLSCMANNNRVKRVAGKFTGWDLNHLHHCSDRKTHTYEAVFASLPIPLLKESFSGTPLTTAFGRHAEGKLYEALFPPTHSEQYVKVVSILSEAQLIPESMRLIAVPKPRAADHLSKLSEYKQEHTEPTEKTYLNSRDLKINKNDFSLIKEPSLENDAASIRGYVDKNCAKSHKIYRLHPNDVKRFLMTKQFEPFSKVFEDNFYELTHYGIDTTGVFAFRLYEFGITLSSFHSVLQIPPSSMEILRLSKNRAEQVKKDAKKVIQIMGNMLSLEQASFLLGSPQDPYEFKEKCRGLGVIDLGIVGQRAENDEVGIYSPSERIYVNAALFVNAFVTP